MKVGIIPDAHVPFHSAKSFSLVLRHLQQEKVDTIVVLGDFCDFWSISRHRKDPGRKLRLAQELGTCRSAIREVESLGADRLIFCVGNHEDRLARYIADKAPELEGVINLPTALGLGDWEIVPYTSYKKVEGVIYSHDFGSTMGGRTALPNAFKAAGQSLVIGHIHRQEIIRGNDIHGKPAVAYSPGWLGNPASIDYRHRALVSRDWSWGFGIIDDGVLRPFSISRSYQVSEGIPTR